MSSKVENVSIGRGEERHLFFQIEQEMQLEITLASDAVCDVVLLHSSESDSTLQARSILGAHARIHWHIVTLGKGTVAQDVRSEMQGADAESSMD